MLANATRRVYIDKKPVYVHTNIYVPHAHRTLIHEMSFIGGQINIYVAHIIFFPAYTYESLNPAICRDLDRGAPSSRIYPAIDLSGIYRWSVDQLGMSLK